MPYKHISLKIPRDLDRRVKLSLEDRAKIKEEYELIHSQRKLALKWGVSRRLIQFILNPGTENKQNKLSYYNKEKHREYMKNHRKYKQSLYLKGELK